MTLNNKAINNFKRIYRKNLNNNDIRNLDASGTSLETMQERNKNISGQKPFIMEKDFYTNAYANQD